MGGPERPPAAINKAGARIAEAEDESAGSVAARGGFVTLRDTPRRTGGFVSCHRVPAEVLGTSSGEVSRARSSLSKPIHGLGALHAIAVGLF